MATRPSFIKINFVAGKLNLRIIPNKIYMYITIDFFFTFSYIIDP